jgi:hypothetical protein
MVGCCFCTYGLALKKLKRGMRDPIAPPIKGYEVIEATVSRLSSDISYLIVNS